MVSTLETSTICRCCVTSSASVAFGRTTTGRVGNSLWRVAFHQSSRLTRYANAAVAAATAIAPVRCLLISPLPRIGRSPARVAGGERCLDAGERHVAEQAPCVVGDRYRPEPELEHQGERFFEERQDGSSPFASR